MSTRFPQTAEEITPEWLTRVLAANLDAGSANVVSVEVANIGDGAGVASDVWRVHLTYEPPTIDGPSSVVVKLPRRDVPSNPVIADMNRREISFYSELAADCGMETPRVFYAESDRNSPAFATVVDDLGSLRTVEPTDGCGFHDARVALTSAARMHAKWWDNPALSQFSWLSALPIPTPVEVAQQRYNDGLDNFLELAAEHLPLGIENVGRKLGPRISKVLDHLGSGPRTLVHGDFSLSNLFFSETSSDEPGIVAFDWQLVSNVRGAYDVAYFLTCEMGVDARRTHERTLIAEYHTALVDGGVRDYSEDELWRDIRMAALIRLVSRVNVAARVGARMMQNESGRRTTTAIWNRLQSIIDWNCEEVIP